MILEAAQVAAEAAKQGGSINIAIPTAVVTSVLTGIAVKAPDILARMRGKRRNGNGGPKPGEAEICRIRGERMATAEAKVENVETSLVRIESKVDRLLERK